MQLDEKIRYRFEREALKHDLHGDQYLSDYLDEKINNLTNSELLFYIALELGDI